jgi:DNA-binding LacI/PurR family transcriptional regulator
MSVRKIAGITNLSPATVSLSLQNNPNIAAATRARVLAAASQIGYKPNAKIAELMSQIRRASKPGEGVCLGVVSLYDTPRPWENSLHLARMYRGMTGGAEALGYRLEPFWMRAPGMSARRFCSVLDARGINGLLCFGSQDIDADFPRELDHYAIVTQGLSIRTPLHRVINHAYNDTLHALRRVHALGYRRPGLLLGQYEDERGGMANASAYLGWCEHTLGVPGVMPILRMNRIEEKPLHDWLKRHAPDVVVVVHVYDVLGELHAALKKLGYKVPETIGVVALSQVLEGTPFSGLEENQQLMGAWAVELLIARIVNRDFGMPTRPHLELVESEWVKGKTLRG